MDPLPLKTDVETKTVLRKAALAHKALAELKGVIATIPNQNILNETLTLREARESSAIENIISTFDEVYRSNLAIQQFATPEAKEVHLYAEALKKGFELVSKNHLLTTNYILQIQKVLIQNDAGFRRLPGTVLKNDRTGETIYTPPQDYNSVRSLMKNLEKFINDDDMMDADPLVKMAIIHHQFESIHPFYDGNGRTGRIINILYLIIKNLLDLPILYLSRFVIQNKNKYYSLLQKGREQNEWEEWLLFMLDGVEKTARETIVLISNIRRLMQSYKEQIRSELPKMYSQDLLDNLFRYPYTKIEYLQRDLGKSRNTIISYLESLVSAGLLIKQKKGRDNFYINEQLFDLLSGKKTSIKTMKEKVEEIKNILCKAIHERHIIRFYYESEKSGKKEWRNIRPYMIAIKPNGSVYMAGLPIEKLHKKQDRQPGHYLLSKLDLDKLEILKETFDDPGVDRDIVVTTKQVKVICRFIYDDEDEVKVRSKWTKI